MSEHISVQVEVLGPIRARDAAGRDVTPVGALQRRLLALLVLRRGHVVPADVAIDVLWPSRLPADPAAALQNHLFRLRRALPPDAVETVGDGYRIDPHRIDLDADRLSAAVAVDGSVDPTWLATVDAVLARWTGPAYPELDDTDEGRAEAARLEELRTRARERRAEVRLASGDTEGLVAELSALADAEPLRERPRELLMSALAASGRTAEALRVYDDFRRTLGDELGIEPSPVLATLHGALVRGEASGHTPATAGRLPVPATSLVGRESLVAELTALTDEHRLVTLVGPGGVGKTRAVIEVGHRLRDLRPDRPVVLCELATHDATTAADAVAAALGVDARPGVPAVDRLVDVLGDADAVVLLDNCEHVLEPTAALVDRLLTRCAGVRVAATSRERLRVPGEHVRSVPPLPAGADDAPAVRLFVERARAVAPDFEPGPDELACIAEVTTRLDGLPLAIELAAARMHTHDVGELAAGLDRRFTLLASGPRASARHASLGAVMAWSYDLLDESLRRTFADLSVFAGPFDVVAAAAVCDIDEAAATHALVELVERSLVLRAPGRRFVLLETLRAFGAEQLATSDRAGGVAARHAHHHVDWVERADRRWLDPDADVVGEIDAALPELRTALAWSLDHGEVALAGRLVASVLDYGIMRLRPDVLAWAERVLASDPDDRSPRAAVVWVVAAYTAWMSGDRDATAMRSAHALQVAEAAGHLPPEVPTILGSAALFDGRLDDAIAWYGRAVDAATDDRIQRLMASSSALLARGYAGDESVVRRAATVLDEVGDQTTPYAAYSWYCAGEALLSFDLDLARTRLVAALELAEATRTSFVIGLAGASMASIDARLGDPLAAAAAYRRLIDHWRRAGMWSTQWTMLRSIAVLLDRLGRHRDAAVLEGAVRSTASGHRIFGADAIALDELSARLRAQLGDEAYDAAREQGAVLDGDAAIEHALRAL